ncbi:MAG: HD domain-containing protein [Spirochaetia bacterium]|nr:HD domain-containing protein [Spirochaetia bacterium]
MKIPDILKKMNEIFVQHGYKAYLVGGAVRDMLMGKEPHDWDVTTDATPEQVMSIFRKVIPTGIAHGTVTVHFMKNEIEVTTFRTESDYSDGRHPDKVEYTGNIEEDLSRRDFTINAIASYLGDGTITDPFHGRDDIKRKVIRTVGNPLERFSEDGLRPVRAVRFSAQLGFEIERETLKAISEPEILKKTSGISLERFRDELLKLMKAEKPSAGLKLMEESGILDIFIPEFKKCRGCLQGDFRGYHQFDVLDHLFYACDGAPASKQNVRLAALFHDIGKPDVKRVIPTPQGDQFTFYNHEAKSQQITKEILFRLKFSNAEIANICHLVVNHMFNYTQDWTDAAVRRFLAKIQAENLEDLYDLRLADIYGMNNAPVRGQDSRTIALLNELKDRISKETEKNSVLSLKQLAVNGKDLMKNGISAGKDLGFVLNQLLETVMEDPSQNEKEQLIKIALNIYKKRTEK